MGLKESEHIAKILIHPDNSDVIYVAATGPLWSEGGQRGVYKSTDGGENWEAVLTIDEHTGIADMVMDPRDPDVIYATAWRAERKPWTIISGSYQDGIYRSTDGGDTWQGSGTAYWTRGQDMVGACNLLGVDVMTGHWEFTYLDEEVIKNVGEFAGDFVAQNVKVTEEALFDYRFSDFEGFNEDTGLVCLPIARGALAAFRPWQANLHLAEVRRDLERPRDRIEGRVAVAEPVLRPCQGDQCLGIRRVDRERALRQFASLRERRARCALVADEVQRIGDLA